MAQQLGSTFEDLVRVFVKSQTVLHRTQKQVVELITIQEGSCRKRNEHGSPRIEGAKLRAGPPTSVRNIHCRGVR